MTRKAPHVTTVLSPLTPRERLLSELLGDLDTSANRLAYLDQHYAGEAPISFLSPEARTALGNRLRSLSTNLPRLAVTSLAERLRIQGFRVNGERDDALAQAWRRNDLDQMAGVLHREALALGRGFVIVWGDEDGRARVTVESASQVFVRRDPATRRVTAAVKRWEEGFQTHVLLMLDDEIVHYVADRRAFGSSITGFYVVESTPNPLGEVPVVPFFNGDRLLTDGVSEMADILPLSDALTKLLADLMVGSEFYARPRRWATGIELAEDVEGNPVNPFPEGDRMMVTEATEAKFGALPAANLSSYREAVDIILSQIMAVSALPAHYVGVTSMSPASADANRSAEASITARAEARQSTFGPAWERVARLILAVESGAVPSNFEVAVMWNDPATRSIAQEADAVVKLYQSGLLPQTYALARLGYSDDAIREIRTASRLDALDRGMLPGAPVAAVTSTPVTGGVPEVPVRGDAAL